MKNTTIIKHLVFLSLVLFYGCGAKSGLNVPELPEPNRYEVPLGSVPVFYEEAIQACEDNGWVLATGPVLGTPEYDAILAACKTDVVDYHTCWLLGDEIDPFTMRPGHPDLVTFDGSIEIRELGMFYPVCDTEG